MPNNLQDTVKLNNGVEMPWFGLGVYKAQEGEEVIQAVKAAIRAGYRSIDTAAAYNNEEGVGQAIREAMKENGLSRDQIFVTSKVWNNMQGYETTLEAFETSRGDSHAVGPGTQSRKAVEAFRVRYGSCFKVVGNVDRSDLRADHDSAAGIGHDSGQNRGVLREERNHRDRESE